MPVLLFEESLNRPLQFKQLYVHIRFWDGDCVSTRFFDSHCFGHVCAIDLYEPLCLNCNTVGIHAILQLSMDGPNVDWKLLETLFRDLEEIGYKLLNIASCGLHIMHNAFRTVAFRQWYN